jgi:hypothetical protein
LNKFKLIFVAVMAIAASLGFVVPANAAATDTTKIWVGLGSGHLYDGSYDACTGAIVASGTTQGEDSEFGDAFYAESVTGTYNKLTGALTITSVYAMDPLTGYVNDSTGVNHQAYAYTLTGTVTNNWVTGSYTVTKTPIGGVPETSAPTMFGGQSVWFEVSDIGGSCTPPPILDGENHGQCVSGASKAGVKGATLATIAKVVTKTGLYGSATCPKI